MHSVDASELPDAIASNRHLLGCAAILVMVFAGSLRLFEVLWHRSALADIPKQAGGWIGAIIVVACSAVIHELLHGFGWNIFARVPWQSISFRPSWRVLGFVAHVNVPVPAPAYRASAALPSLVLGVVPIVLGFVTGFGLIVLWGLFFLLECFGDMAVLLAMRKVTSGAWVLDHPNRLGCRIVAEISEEPMTDHAEHTQVPIAFEVRRVIDVVGQDNDPGAAVLTERMLEVPYVKDYDPEWDFDLSNWGLIAAHSKGRRVGGAVIAFNTPGITMLEGRNDLAVLWDIRVAPEGRGEGVGSALFGAVERWAVARGCRRLKVETQNVNVPACRFYQRQGCVLGGIRHFAYPEFPQEVQLLWYKDL